MKKEYIVKKILIFSHAMEIGGAERALIGLLETIDTTKYQVDLFLMRHEGELLKYIPEGIRLLPESKQYSCMAIPFGKVLKRGCFGVAAGRFLGKQKAARRVKELGLTGENDVALEYSHKFTVPFLPMVSRETYDLAISFLTPHYYVAQKVKSKKKIAWIHTDYSIVATDRESQRNMWDAYDWIASISERVTEGFLKAFPELEKKILLIPNIMPVRYLDSMTKAFSAEQEMPMDGSIRLLSVGRFCSAKNFDNVPDICRRLREVGHNVKWYLIGFGGSEALIRQKIMEAGMEREVIILGKKENPYPYIAACDLYVQPSRYEGKCVSVIEAQILHKPVVIAAYATSGSQLRDGYDGVIVPMDNAGCAEGIAAVLRDPALQQRLMENTKKQDYTNSKEIEKIYQLLEH